MKQALLELQSSEQKLTKLAKDGLEPSVQRLNQLDDKVAQVQN